jgi:nucleotide-binding universal stress UspA family protein
MNRTGNLKRRLPMFNTIVWATDGSENADRALPYVISLAKDHPATLTVVHVVEKYATHSAAGLSVYADENQVEKKLTQMVAKLSDEGLDATLKIVSHVGPQPAHEIAHIAREVNADLIVAGTRGHTPIGGLLLGGVTMRLLHVAPCPVLAVPAAKQRGVQDREVEIAQAAL